MEGYLFFFTVRGESGGSSDSPERRGMRGICSTRLKINLVSYLRWCVARAREAFAIAAWHLRETFNDAGGEPGLV